jgi:hypothetical protein
MSYLPMRSRGTAMAGMWGNEKCAWPYPASQRFWPVCRHEFLDLYEADDDMNSTKHDKQPVSVSNISPAGSRRRARSVAAFLIIAAVAAAIMATLRAPPSAYAMLGVPLTLASINFFQVREKT